MKMFRVLPILASSIGLLLALSSNVVSAQEYKKITRLGTSQSVCTGGVETAAELQEYFAQNPNICLLYTSPSPRDLSTSRMPSSA